MIGPDQENFICRGQSERGPRPTTLESSLGPEPRAGNPRWPWVCLIVIVSLALILQILHLAFFNAISNGDGYFIQYAFNVARGQLGFGVLGTLFGTDKYVFGYPFGYPLVMSGVFWLLGPGPVTAKLLPLFSYLSTVGVIVVFGRQALGPWAAVIVGGLLAVDPAFVTTMNQVRPQATLALCFALGGVAYLQGVRTGRAWWMVVTGFTVGLGFLIGLSLYWLVMAIVIHQLLFRGATRHWKEKLCFASSLAVVLVPYAGWILLNPERRALFPVQIFPWTVAFTSTSAWEIGRRFLNPVADLYLLLFRHYSPYPLLLLVVCVVLGFRWRRYAAFLLMILIPLGMLVLNLRAAHYLVPTMPLGYLGLGYALREKGLLPLTSKAQHPSRSLFAVVAGVVMVGMVFHGVRSLRSPTLKIDLPYYRTIFETYTEPGSVIATDLALIFSATEGRVLLSTGPFIWEGFRRHFTYEEIVETLNPDYIVMTERNRAKAFSLHPQARAFQQYLARTFELQELLHHPDNGRLWVYRQTRTVSQESQAR